jgi:hypothetical protein
MTLVVDDIKQEVGHWHITFVGGNPPSSVLDVWKKLTNGGRLVIRDCVHPDFPEQFTGLAFDFTQPWQVILPRLANHRDTYTREWLGKTAGSI